MPGLGATRPSVIIMGSSSSQQWTATHRPAMPSTRRSQASPADSAQQRHASSASLSPKLTRSGRVLPLQDVVERESAARSAKRRKTASPPPDKAVVDRDVEHAPSDDQAQEDLKSVQRAASSDEDGHRAAEVSEEAEEHEQVATRSGPAVSRGHEPGLEGPPTAAAAAAPVPVDASELENLADQILDFYIRKTSRELASAINDPDSEIGKEYVQLHANFTASKQQFSGTRTFISPPDLGLSVSKYVGICRRINLATFVTSLFFGSVGLEELDNYFLFTFLPRGGTLSKLAASLWIELKTQAFVAAVVGSDPRPSSAILSVLFTEDVRNRLLDVRPGVEELVPSEEDFMDDMRSRRNVLGADLAKNDPTALAQRYPWMDLLENIVSYIRILKLDDHKLTGSERLLLKPRQDAAQQGAEKSLSQSDGSNGKVPSRRAKATGYLDTPEESFTHRLARCALLAIQAQGVPFFTHDGHLPYPLIRYSDQLQEDGPAVPDELMTSSPKIPSDETPVSGASVPHSSQTAPTLLLYAKAREASEIEALHPPLSAIDENSKGERRKWTLGEEHALMEGLDRVRGPHWGQILFDEQLKDRTESELKDKARSLKLFFLKAGIEVPFYLKDASKSGSSAMPLKQEEDQASVASAPAEAEGV